MNRSQAKELSPIIQAFSEGKPIQYRVRDNESAIWNDVDKDYHEFEPHSFQYRIKPNSTYRPFANAEECWAEMLKHQPFGWIKCYEGYLNITYVGDEQVYLADPDGGAILLDSKNSYQDNTFVDGTPFGIKVEE